MKIKKIYVDRLDITALILVFIAVLFRLLLLELRPVTSSPDHYTVALMGRNIFLKGEFPFFFYGQNWFGTIESFLSAVYFDWFGISTKVLAYAPLTFFALFMLVTYLLSSNLFNKKVGLWTLAWCIVPPRFLLDYGLNPQGGYIETLTFGSLVLLLAVYLLKTKSERLRTLLYFLVGWAAGFSWWTSPLTIYYILTAAVFILLTQKAKIFFLNGILSLLGFVIGSLPFWIFHVIHGKGLGGFTGGFRFDHLKEGLSQLFLKDIPSFLDAVYLDKNFSVLFWSILIFYLISFLFFLGKAGKDFLKLGSFYRKDISGSSILLLFFLFFILIYSSSQLGLRGIVRYLLPLFSLIPMTVGVFLAWLGGKARWAPILLLASFMGLQIPNLQRYVLSNSIESVKEATVRKLTDTVLKLGINRGIVEYSLGPRMTFASNEKVILCSPQGEKHHPYQNEVENSDNPAFIFKYSSREVEEALKYLGGSASLKEVEGFHIYYDFKEPLPLYRQILTDQWTVSTTENARMRGHAFDRSSDTVWTCENLAKEEESFQLDLGQTHSLGMIRLFHQPGHHRFYPSNIKVEVSHDQVHWEKIAQLDHSQNVLSYYWSGPRLYTWAQLYRLEIRFSPVQARYVRFSQKSEHRSFWGINEIFIYEPLGLEMSSMEKIDDLMNYLMSHPFDFVYADRWISAKIKDKTMGKIKTYPSYTDSHYRMAGIPSPIVHFGPKTAFVIPIEDENYFSRMIHEFGFELEKKIFGRHAVFSFKEWTSAHQSFLGNSKGFFWIGFGLLHINSKRSLNHANIAKQKSLSRDFQSALVHYEKALLYNPYHEEARRGKIRSLKRLGRFHESRQDRRRLWIESVPSKDKSWIEFENETQLLGFQLLDSQEIEEVPSIVWPLSTLGVGKRGQEIRIRSLWRLNHKRASDKLAVFLHFESKNEFFQADHKLLGKDVHSFGLDRQFLIKEHKMIIPTNIPLENYQIKIGLYEVGSRRWNILQSNLKYKDNRAEVGNLEIMM